MVDNLVWALGRKRTATFGLEVMTRDKVGWQRRTSSPGRPHVVPVTTDRLRRVKPKRDLRNVLSSGLTRIANRTAVAAQMWDQPLSLFA